eukprot:3663455-Amphidinium_carterae.1
MQGCATKTRSRHVNQTEQAVRLTKMKAHDDAVKTGFPSFLRRCFERPVFRRQQAEEGVGPFFCLGVRTGELLARDEFNLTWIKQQFSAHAAVEAGIYLRILNEWANASMQGDPATPIGRRTEDSERNTERTKGIKCSSTIRATAPLPRHWLPDLAFHEPNTCNPGGCVCKIGSNRSTLRCTGCSTKRARPTSAMS